SHTFNLLDARGMISVSDRAGYLGRIRKMARSVAQAFVAEREALGFPLLKNSESEA
ncbi:glycine--tRNA ligase subunit alpha, partial [Abiotrophia defectiva]